MSDRKEQIEDRRSAIRLLSNHLSSSDSICNSWGVKLMSSVSWAIFTEVPAFLQRTRVDFGEERSVQKTSRIISTDRSVRAPDNDHDKGFELFDATSCKMSLPIVKKTREEEPEGYIDVSKEAKTFVDKILGDVSKTSATKQIIIGTTSGWITGFLTMKVGKVAAFAVGGGIIILQIAANQGYIKINWDKIQRKAEKITDKVEEKVTGEGPRFMDKVGKWWRKNSYVATSFVGGFIIGLAS
ncbi:hypothetical protein KM043_007760 [Ampulex compressa]|nr:hypothetical protein KM043_007760 [Ampulex compressa]